MVFLGINAFYHTLVSYQVSLNYSFWEVFNAAES
jgi:hypothetical protein